LPFGSKGQGKVSSVWKRTEWIQLVKETNVNTTKTENLLDSINWELYNTVFEPLLILVAKQ